MFRRLFPRTSRRIQCQHADARGIYGDEIIAVGYRRGYCYACHTLLDSIPQKVGQPDASDAS